MEMPILNQFMTFYFSVTTNGSTTTILHRVWQLEAQIPAAATHEDELS
jgi:hypothetical protein